VISAFYGDRQMFEAAFVSPSDIFLGDIVTSRETLFLIPARLISTFSARI
jgi:hypothetical protein